MELRISEAIGPQIIAYWSGERVKMMFLYGLDFELAMISIHSVKQTSMFLRTETVS